MYDDDDFKPIIEDRTFEDLIGIFLEKDLGPVSAAIDTAMREYQVEVALDEVNGALAGLRPRY